MSHSLPLVSVINTTYRNEIYLPRAIESVLNQSYSNIELIVVDDNAPDSQARTNTEAVMTRYPQAVYLKHPENRNGAAARNRSQSCTDSPTGKTLCSCKCLTRKPGDHIT